nr:MAG TPA: hypothetical protein [Caudoviricetes sp.]
MCACVRTGARVRGKSGPNFFLLIVFSSPLIF